MKIYKEAVYHWRIWFAWYPVRTIYFEWVWLEKVERKIEDAKIPNVSPSSWKIYRRIKKVIK